MSQLRPLDQIPSDMPQPTGPPAVQDEISQPEFRFWWYCTEDTHPSVPIYGAQPLDIRRIFGTNSDQGCPTCSGCGREVAAIPCAGPSIPPAGVVEYARRFVNQQTVGGIRR